MVSLGFTTIPQGAARRWPSVGPKPKPRIHALVNKQAWRSGIAFNGVVYTSQDRWHVTADLTEARSIRRPMRVISCARVKLERKVRKWHAHVWVNYAALYDALRGQPVVRCG